MIKLGITGGIGSGKSIITQLFSLFDIPVYIADTRSKRITETSCVIREKLIDLFGKDLYFDNSLDKKKLASIIFNDKEKLQIVNSIIHPEVFKDYQKWCLLNNSAPISVLESAILFESKMDKLIDKSLLVYTPIEDRIQRTMIRDKSTKDLVIKRIKNQISDEMKLNKVDFVIYNNEKISLIQQVNSLLFNLL